MNEHIWKMKEVLWCTGKATQVYNTWRMIDQHGWCMYLHGVTMSYKQYSQLAITSRSIIIQLHLSTTLYDYNTSTIDSQKVNNEW